MLLLVHLPAPLPLLRPSTPTALAAVQREMATAWLAGTGRMASAAPGARGARHR